MLTGMRLKNFKSWEDTGDIALRPISGFFGPNSSGKTSLVQALLMLKQTAESSDRGAIFQFGDQRSPVNLGDFLSVVHKHDASRELEISLDWKMDGTFKVWDTNTDEIVAKDDFMGFEVVSREVTRRSQKSLAVKQMSYRVGNAVFGMQQGSQQRYELFCEGVDFEFARRVGRPGHSTSPVKSYGFPDQVRADFRNAEFVADLEYELEELLRKVYYLGPLRTAPERRYAWSGTQPRDVGQAGEFAIESILSSRERGEKIGQGSGRPRLTVEQYVAQWLRKLELTHEFRVAPLAEGVSVYEAMVRESSESAEVLITDVGFGVSQVLPVLVQCFYVPSGSTVILEQPDIHLHPVAQALLADVLIDAWERRKVQVLVESHSEHLLHRIQRRIAEERISEEDVGMYFCSSSSGRSELTRLEVNEFGRIANWPKNFFGDMFGEIAATRKAGLTRQIEQGAHDE